MAPPCHCDLQNTLAVARRTLRLAYLSPQRGRGRADRNKTCAMRPVPRRTRLPLGHELTAVAAAEPLPEGAVALGLSFDYDGGGLGKGASVSLHVNDITVASGRIERTVPFRFSMSGETLDVGTDTGSPV